MSSREKTDPTSPPTGPALVRPVVGALLLSLGPVACASKPLPPMPPPTEHEVPTAEDEAPMPEEQPPMVDAPPMPEEQPPMLEGAAPMPPPDDPAD